MSFFSSASVGFLEIGNSQAESVVNLFDNNQINCLEIVKDLQNLNRVLVLKKSWYIGGIYIIILIIL